MPARPRYLAGVATPFRTAALTLACTAVTMACGQTERGAQNGRAPGSGGAPDAAEKSGASPTVVEGHAIIRAEGVGPLRLMAWRRPAMSLVYPVGATAGPNDEDVITVRGIGRDTLTLAFADDTLRWIRVDHPGPHTSEGLGVGTPLSSVARETGARSSSVGRMHVVTLARYCGIQFRSDTTGPAEPRVASILVKQCTPAGSMAAPAPSTRGHSGTGNT